MTTPSPTQTTSSAFQKEGRTRVAGESRDGVDRPATKVAFARLSALQRELLRGLHSKQTTVSEFAAERGMSASSIRLQMRQAMRLLVDGASETPIVDVERTPWDEQRRSLLAALASAEVVMDAERRALEMIVARKPLVTVLDVLTRGVEECCGTASVAAILLASADGRQLFTGSAPSLPDDYNAAIDGLEIVANVGTCLAAAASKEVVVTNDIAADPNWAGLSHLPLGLGLLAAWSRPILGSNGVLLGTFGTYFRTARRPTPTEFAVVTVLAHIAAIAIERENVEARREGDREELRTANIALSDTNASLDEFVSLISHELLAPLTVMQGSVRLLAASGLEDDVRSQLMAEVEGTASRMARTVNGLVVVARSGHGPSTELEPVRVGIAVKAICDSYLSSANVIEVRAVESPFEDIVLGSNIYLEQIIVNLLSNASKYGGAGEAIQVVVETGARSVQVTVSDRGRGIPHDEASQIFGRFFRGRDGKQDQSGLGVGLTVCKRLAHAMKGDVRFNARDGGGTAFVLELPRAEISEL